MNFPQKPIISNEGKDFIRNCLAYDQNNRWDINDAYNSPYIQSI